MNEGRGITTVQVESKNGLRNSQLPTPIFRRDTSFVLVSLE